MNAAFLALLTKDKKSIVMVNRRNSKLLGLAGGKSEPNETPIATAIRETIEETGITEFSVIDEIHNTIVQDDGVAYNVTTFLAFMNDDISTVGIEEGIKTSTIPIYFMDDPSIVFLPDYFKEIKKQIFKYLFPEPLIKVDPLEFKNEPTQFIPSLTATQIEKIKELTHDTPRTLSFTVKPTGIGDAITLTIDDIEHDITDYDSW